MREGVVRGGRLALAALLVCAAAPALAAASPFGVGLPESGGGGFLPWVGALQKSFYGDLTAALKALKADGSAAWWLASLSFLYGIVHAAGPGHGKVVISSYLLANEESARRGILISFASALLQASVAVALVAVMAALLGMTSFAMTRTARLLEIGSYALIAALGTSLLWRKGRALSAAFAAPPPLLRAAPLGAQVVAHGHDAHDHDHAHSHDPGTCGCGHHHAPVVERARGLRAASLAVLSVGLRPCSGAIIVLVFALAQGIFWAGIASTYLMGLGTALTVAALAALAVGAKGLAARLVSGDGGRARRLMLGLELSGALVVTAFGLVLLGGALSA